MPSQHLFSREIEVCLNVLTIEQKLEGDVNCVVWDAALVLSKYLELQCLKNNMTLKGVNVVELGSGLGCVGLSAACLGANVILTDLAEAIPLLEANINNNLEVINNANGKATAKVVHWGKENDLNVKPDLILLADCVYYSEAVSLLIKTLTDLSTPSCEILLSQENRDSETQIKIWNSFLCMIEEMFHIEEIPLSEQHPDYRSHDIKLFRLKHFHSS